MPMWAVAGGVIALVAFVYVLVTFAYPHVADLFANTEEGKEAAAARLEIMKRKAAGEQGIIQITDCVQKPDGYEQGFYDKIPDTIFVSVASYRDDECKDTVYDMFAKAKKPELLFVGVCQQNKEGEEDCFDRCSECARRKASGNIRVLNFPHLEARGPTFARYHCSRLWRGEEYFLQIDSHTRFEEGWDETLKEQMRSTNDPKAVVGAYPPTQEQMDEMKKNGFTTMITMCPGPFDSSGLSTITAQVVSTNGRKTPLPTAYVPAGLMCMPGAALYDVPYDPYLAYLFFGEELLYSARLYTNGYNLYAPVKHFCVHHYGREDKPKYWQDHKDSEPCKKKALQRVKYILGFIRESQVHPDYFLDIEKYGLGSKRSIAEYFKIAKIHPMTKTVTQECPMP